MLFKAIDIEQRVTDFLNSAPRHKVIVLLNDVLGALSPSLNVGKEVAGYLESHSISQYAKNSAKQFLSNRITQATACDPELGPWVCLCNLGILFERELDFSPTDFLASLSRNTLLILRWPGVAREGKLFFLDENSRYYLDFTQVNHITL